MITFVVLAVASLVIMIKPWWGMIMIMAMLYFPLLPNIQFGIWEASPTAPLFLLLALRSLPVASRFGKRWAAVRYQWMLAGLGIVFLLVILLSQNLETSLSLLPNLFIYIVILFTCLVFVRSPAQLVGIVKVIILLTLLLSIWRVELKMFRGILGLPSLSINGAIFNFHPAFALSLVVLLVRGKTFSMFWRFMAVLLITSIVYHGLLYQSRAGWLAWVVMLTVFIFRMRLGRTVRLILIIGVAVVFAVTQFSDVLETNWLSTQTAWQAFVSEDADLAYDSGDRGRIVLQEAALEFFKVRPFTGWGPGVYRISSREQYLPIVGSGAAGSVFNAWLLSLADMGLLTTLLIMGLFLTPIWIVWRSPVKKQDEISILCFGFAVGVVGLVVHLFFIDLLYSFVYFIVGLALAATEVLRRQMNVKQDIERYAQNAPRVPLSRSRI